MAFLVAVEGDAGGWRVDQDPLTKAILGRWAGAAIRLEHPSDVRSEHRLTHRIKRQGILHRDGPPPYSAVIHEAALRMGFGGPAIARGPRDRRSRRFPWLPEDAYQGRHSRKVQRLGSRPIDESTTVS